MAQYRIRLASRLLYGPAEVLVVTPDPPEQGSPRAYYEKEPRYPVLWLLHGGNGDGSDWLNNTRIALYARERGFVAVMPSGLNSDFADHPEFADGYNFFTYFFEELTPFIQNRFPVSAKPADNFLTGYSMGGAAVWMFGLMHPELFGGIAPLSSAPRNYGYLEPYRAMSAADFRSFAQKSGPSLPSGYGNPKNGLLPKEINMIAKYPSVGDFLDSMEHTYRRFFENAEKGLLPPKIFAACGEMDRGCDKLRAFEIEAKARCGEERIRFAYSPRAGHDYFFWDAMLPKLLDYFAL